MRDYIHVMDLADGHVAAMQQLADKPGVHIYNLGAGVGSSVLDVVNAFSKSLRQASEVSLRAAS